MRLGTSQSLAEATNALSNITTAAKAHARPGRVARAPACSVHLVRRRVDALRSTPHVKTDSRRRSWRADADPRRGSVAGKLRGPASATGAAHGQERGGPGPHRRHANRVPGFRNGGTVDHRTNSFTATDMVGDFDMGKTRRLANGKVLGEWEIVAEDTIACHHSATGGGRPIAAALPTARAAPGRPTRPSPPRRWPAKPEILTCRIVPVGL